MSSEEIKTIYKKLVQSYVNDYPRANPLWVLNNVLNKHIEFYTREEWKAKEPAILDAALRMGIEIPKVKELIEKGITRKEAILEVSKNMKFQVSVEEVKEWLKELKKKEPRTVKEVAKRKMEQQIKDYEKSIERLTNIFSKGEISEESYKIAIKKIERNIDELRSGKEVSVIEERKETIVKPETFHPSYERRYTEPTKLWYLVPLFFGIIGGLIGYVAVKDEDEDMALGLLVFGILMFFVDMFVVWLYYTWLLSLFGI